MKLGLTEPEIFCEMADMFSKTENLIDESINCFNLSLAGDPDQEDLWIKYAEYMIKQGDVPAAIDKYENALKWIGGDVKKEETQ